MRSTLNNARYQMARYRLASHAKDAAESSGVLDLGPLETVNAHYAASQAKDTMADAMGRVTVFEIVELQKNKEMLKL
ncbi:hypothetical protein [Lacticaseibacillus hulanensis]|uniref:hypothetical protein n=1 Tax=Lacticaseibacillus hulanensis TaxID=2493111 RepID=UPI000FDBBE1E|nr:hypothetical protein [Lacticaseibacillus hulanensis]